MNIRHDLYSYIKPISAMDFSASGTTKKMGNIIDTLGFDALELIPIAVAVSAGTWTPEVLASNNADMSNAVTLTGNDLIGTPSGAALTSANNGGANPASLGVVLSIYRYIQANLVPSGGGSGTAQILAILANPDTAAAGNPNSNANTYP